MKIKLITGFLFLSVLFMFGCSRVDNPTNQIIGGNFGTGDDGGDDTSDGETPPNPNDVKTKWDVPGGAGEIIFGCLGRDCIPSIQNPQFVTPENATYLSDDDLVYGIVFRGEARAYPMRILDWHEVVNDELNGKVAITYCPLTGSGLGINTSFTSVEIGENIEGFGVSGLLYNNNLIPYDRGTGSNWSQMYMRCVNGVLRGEKMITVPLIETSFKTWKKMFPDSKILSDDTGFDRPYDLFPYGNYKTVPDLLFPITVADPRLPTKERLHGIVVDRFELQAKTYRFALFSNPLAINDEINGAAVVLAGMQEADFYISYYRSMPDGAILTFDVSTENPQIYPFDLIDNEGNVWNILGECIEGSRTGETLKPTDSYNAYWFAWGSFFPNVPIY